jgi:REase_MTES_1575
VLFSTGFSVDDRGVLPLNFGPLNRVGGERRLNVAVTRARRQVVVLSSFDPSQLRAEQTSSVGVKHLRAYLDLAALGPDALPRDARPVAVPDRHREEIAAALRDRGLSVRTDVGLSEFRVDLSVARGGTPDQPVLAVLLDGPAWARRRTVGDRDGLPVEVLSGMLGWPAVERVWLPTWLRDREAVLDRLVAAVGAVPIAAPAPAPPAPVVQGPAVPAGEGAVPPVPAPAEPPASEVRAIVPLRAAAPAVVETVLPPEPGQVAGSAPPEEVAGLARPARRAARKPAAPLLDGETAFSPWTPRGGLERKALDSLDDPRAARTVRRVLTAGLKAEGPVHRDRLVRAAAGAFGLSRVSEARRDALLRLLPDGVLDGEFAWPESLDRAGWTGFRRQAAGADRPLEHVAPEEVGNAMAALCRAAGELAEDELFVRTAEVFGYRRRTPSLTPLLQAALTRALDGGRLVRQESGVLTSG